MIHKCDCKTKKFSCAHCRGKVREKLFELGVDVLGVHPMRCPEGYPAIYLNGRAIRPFQRMIDAERGAEALALHWAPCFGKALGVGIVGRPETYYLVA